MRRHLYRSATKRAAPPRPLPTSRMTGHRCGIRRLGEIVDGDGARRLAHQHDTLRRVNQIAVRVVTGNAGQLRSNAASCSKIIVPECRPEQNSSEDVGAARMKSALARDRRSIANRRQMERARGRAEATDGTVRQQCGGVRPSGAASTPGRCRECLPSRSDSPCAMRRAQVMGPPETITRTGRAGYGCDHAKRGDATAASAAQEATRYWRRLSFIAPQSVHSVFRSRRIAFRARPSHRM